MELLGQLGIDPTLLIAQIINFGLLLWLLSIFLYRPLLKQIEEGEKEFEKSAIDRKMLEQQQSDFEKQKKQEAAEAQQHIRTIIAEAESTADEIRKRTRDEAEKEKQAVIQQIKSRLSESEHDTRSL
jgi:F-type H+-transporting ATPase subunit b